MVKKAVGKSTRAKYLAEHFAYSFNERFIVRRSLRGIATKTQMTLITVRRAIKDLEATGLLVIDRHYNRKTRRYDIHQYRALRVPKLPRVDVEVPF